MPKENNKVKDLEKQIEILRLQKEVLELQNKVNELSKKVPQLIKFFLFEDSLGRRYFTYDEAAKNKPVRRINAKAENEEEIQKLKSFLTHYNEVMTSVNYNHKCRRFNND